MDFQWKCPVCSKILKHKKSISRHKKTHSNSLHECDKRQINFSRIDNFRRHITKCIKKVKEYRCQKCLTKFNGGQLLKRHLKTHTEDKKVKCKNCRLRIAPSQVENHGHLCIAENPVDSAELTEEFVSMATINRLDLTILNIEL